MNNYLNQVLNIDCFDGMKLLNNNSIDFICTDIPYYKVVEEKWDNQWESENEYYNWFENLAKEYKRILKENGSIIIFTGRQHNKYLSIILDKYFVEQRIIIWKRKRNRSTTRGKALPSGYEPICYYTNNQNIYTFNNFKIKPEEHLLKRKEYQTGNLKDGISVSDVWDINALPHNSKEKTNHPTQKPLELMERCIYMFSNENDIILDTFAGSGTTLKAAKKLNRNFIGFEINKKYYEELILPNL